MDSGFHRSLGISVAFHLAVLLFTSVQIAIHKKYITIPVDLIYYSPPRLAEEIREQRKEEEIVIPKKIKKMVKKKEKPKEAQKEEPKPVHPAPAPTVMQPSSTISPETAQFPYLYYLKNVREKISHNWAWKPQESGRLKTVIYFKIKRNGSITEPYFKEKSNNNLFDSIAMRAVRNSSPFPPLPAGYEEDTLGIYFEFAYKE